MDGSDDLKRLHAGNLELRAIICELLFLLEKEKDVYDGRELLAKAIQRRLVVDGDEPPKAGGQQVLHLGRARQRHKVLVQAERDRRLYCDDGGLVVASTIRELADRLRLLKPDQVPIGDGVNCRPAVGARCGV